MSNLNPHQFVQQHADFEKWAGSEMSKVRQSDPEGFTNAWSRDPEARQTPPARRVRDLSDAREMLRDHYSPNVNALGFGASRQEYIEHLGVPLRHVVQIPHVVDEYENRDKS